MTRSPTSRAALLGLALIGMSACTSTSAAGPEPIRMGAQWSAEEVKSGRSCGADQLGGWIGSVATESAIATLRQWRGEHGLRVLPPGAIVTMDYRPDRLNVDVDKARVITGFHCV